MTTEEQHDVEDAVWNLRRGYDLAALAVLLHLLERGPVVRSELAPMARERS